MREEQPATANTSTTSKSAPQGATTPPPDTQVLCGHIHIYPVLTSTGITIRSSSAPHGPSQSERKRQDNQATPSSSSVRVMLSSLKHVSLLALLLVPAACDCISGTCRVGAPPSDKAAQIILPLLASLLLVIAPSHTALAAYTDTPTEMCHNASHHHFLYPPIHLPNPGGAANIDVKSLLRGGDNEDNSSGVKVAGCAMPLILEISKQQHKADLRLGISVRTSLGDSVRLFIHVFMYLFIYLFIRRLFIYSFFQTKIRRSG